VRIQVSEPELLHELCRHLSRQGCVAVEEGGDEAQVLIPGATSDREAEAMLPAELDLWQASRAGVRVTVDSMA